MLGRAEDDTVVADTDGKIAAENTNRKRCTYKRKADDDLGGWPYNKRVV